MILIVTSFIAGMLSVLAPCVVAFIPIIFSRTTSGRRPWRILFGLAVSIFIFSILLKATTLLIDIPSTFWSVLSGVIILIFGVITVYPGLWEKASLKLGFSLGAQRRLAKANTRRGLGGDILLGASLGPIFSACSPTYALIVATLLPADPLRGMVYLVAYIVGLLFLLTLIILFGKKLLMTLGWGINPDSSFHRVLGVVLIILGIAIITGLDKAALSLLVENGWFDWQINLETGLIQE